MKAHEKLNMDEATFKKLFNKAVNENFVSVGEDGTLIPDRLKIQAEIDMVEKSISERKCKKWYQFWK